MDSMTRDGKIIEKAIQHRLLICSTDRREMCIDTFIKGRHRSKLQTHIQVVLIEAKEEVTAPLRLSRDGLCLQVDAE
jgi:hypothetical protein